MSTYRIIEGDVRERLADLEEASVQTCITSPPYWGLRDYGTATWDGGDSGCDHTEQAIGMSESNTLGPKKHLPNTNAANVGRKLQYKQTCGKCGAQRIDDQLGLEATPEEYTANLVAVFREVRRVLRDDGTLWLNLGDSYAGSTTANTGRNDGDSDYRARTGNGQHLSHDYAAKQERTTITRNHGLKPKDLVGIPWRVAFALQADGWYLRSDIIWHKPNPMPESVRDRPTKSHEYVFLLTKSPRYYYDADAIREAGTIPAGTLAAKGSSERTAQPGVNSRPPEYKVYDGQRNKRSVWTVTTKPFSGAHFAVFPPDLIEPCVLAGSAPSACGECGAPYERIVEREGSKPKRVGKSKAKNEQGLVTAFSGYEDGSKSPTFHTLGWQPTCDHSDDSGKSVVLDPFSGSGTTGMVALRHGRDFVGTELNPKYAQMARDRIRDDAPLLNEAAA